MYVGGIHNKRFQPGLSSARSLAHAKQQAKGSSLPLFLHPKLAISQPSDPAEVEADRVADQVMRMPEPVVQRQCAAYASGGQPCPACEQEKPVSVSRKAQGAIGGDAPASVGSVIRSPGQPLAASTRAFFEPRFGQDLSHVRVHTDRAAQQSAQAVNALAYTVGSHVVFDAGRYAPHSPDGKRLLGHELTHVVQQVGADSWRLARKEVWEDGRLDEEQAAGQIPRGTCGPEISKALAKTVGDVRSKFAAASAPTRGAACLTLISLPTAGLAWDIQELNSDGYKDWIGYYKGCATEACGSSVAVSGHCHYPDTVNYVLYGTAMRLCYDWSKVLGMDRYAEDHYSEEAMKTYISVWKKAKVWKSVLGKTHEAGAISWAVLGWHGYKPGRALSAELPDCDPSCGDYMGAFTWTWLGLHTPKAEE
ncbi:MAG: DUF4157 domain-containing protein [Nitrospirota bacterium]|nr:DUF4157 domain-containing protein [Nitrospirota bacterium]MDP2383244.1 DUF4157 domain-containing protein [Nitrospirota bacterium]MDP3599381.1 DUF4157 domain-containing protein [Nitrospirota bacterium]